MSSPASQAILANYALYRQTQQPTNSSTTQPKPPLPSVPYSTLSSNTMGNAPSEMSIIHNPLPAPPTITISRDVLNRSNSLRESMGLPPLQTTANLNIVGTNIGQSNKDVIAKLQDLKNQGVSTIEIVDKNGNVSTTNAQNIAKARYDILQKQIQTGDSVSLRIPGENRTTVTTTTGPEYFRQNDNPLKSTLAGIAGTLAVPGLAIMNLPSIIGEYAKGKNPYDVGTQYEQSIGTQIQKAVGPSYLDKLMSGDFSASGMTPGEKAGSLIGSGIGLYLLGGGPGLQGLVGRIAKPILTTGLAKTVTQGIVNRSVQKTASTFQKIASGFSKGNTYGIDYIGKTGDYLGRGQVSTLGELGIGGESSGIKQFVPETTTSLSRTGPEVSKTISHATDVYGKNIGDTVEKIVNPGTGKVETITAKPPIPETKTVTGIGSKGEAIPRQVPNVIDIKELVPSETPFGILGKKFSIITRSTPSELPPQYFLTDALQGITKEQADYLGLQSVAGKPGVYFGKATPETQGKVLELITQGKLKVGTDQFLFPTEDIAKNVSRYAEATINPKMFLGENFPGLTRPVVIKFLIGGGKYGLKSFPKALRNVGKGTGKPFTASDLLPSSFGGPGVAGSAGRANALLTDIVKNIPQTQVNVPKGPGIVQQSPKYFTTTITNRPTGRRGRVTEETYYLAYPPGTKFDVSKVGGKTIQYTGQSQRLSHLLDNTLESVGKVGLRTININILGQGTRTIQRSARQEGITITIPRLDIVTGQTTTTRQKQTSELITIPKPDQITKQVTRTTEGPGIPIVIPDLRSYFSGGGTRKKKSTKATQFVYSVNPNKVGAIAEAGNIGKRVGQIGQNIDYQFKNVKIKTPKIKKTKLRF